LFETKFLPLLLA